MQYCHHVAGLCIQLLRTTSARTDISKSQLQQSCPKSSHNSISSRPGSWFTLLWEYSIDGNLIIYSAPELERLPICSRSAIYCILPVRLPVEAIILHSSVNLLTINFILFTEIWDYPNWRGIGKSKRHHFLHIFLFLLNLTKLEYGKAMI